MSSLVGDTASLPDSSAMFAESPVLLHVFNSFGSGGAQTRFIQLANHFHRRFRHVVVARNGDYAAAGQLSSDADVTLYPWRDSSVSLLDDLRRISAVIRDVRPDKLITHNWGTINWVIANLAFGIRHIHIEDGFGPDESLKLKLRRVIARRLLLRRSELVVPSLTLQRIAQDRWQIESQKLHYIPNGIDCERFAQAREICTAVRPDNEIPVVGTVAALRPEKNCARLLRAFASVRRELECRLVIVGDGDERGRLESIVQDLGIASSVTFAGFIANPAAHYRRFDVFVLTSDTEQMPYTVLEAMASGLPVVSTDVGDVRSMVANENDLLIVPPDDDQIGAGIMRAIADRALGRRIGVANAARARDCYSQAAMFKAFGDLYDAPSMSGRRR